VVYCPGKTKEQIRDICVEIKKNKQALLLTRLEKEVFLYLKKSFPGLRYNSVAKIGYFIFKRTAHNAQRTAQKGFIIVISAGTADLPVAEEAAVTAEAMGNKVTRLFDVGVAGVHRLMHKMELVRKANVIIVVAGMEGALPSVISGLANVPVIGVPTSVGYGTGAGGKAALYTMLNSCTPVAVVNIDNGFGAAVIAAQIVRRKTQWQP